MGGPRLDENRLISRRWIGRESARPGDSGTRFGHAEGRPHGVSGQAVRFEKLQKTQRRCRHDRLAGIGEEPHGRQVESPGGHLLDSLVEQAIDEVGRPRDGDLVAVEPFQPAQRVFHDRRRGALDLRASEIDRHDGKKHERPT